MIEEHSRPVFVVDKVIKVDRFVYEALRFQLEYAGVADRIVEGDDDGTIALAGIAVTTNEAALAKAGITESRITDVEELQRLCANSYAGTLRLTRSLQKARRERNELRAILTRHQTHESAETISMLSDGKHPAVIAFRDLPVLVTWIERDGSVVEIMTLRYPSSEAEDGAGLVSAEGENHGQEGRREDRHQEDHPDEGTEEGTEGAES